METKGHIISDAQFKEYQELKKNTTYIGNLDIYYPQAEGVAFKRSIRIEANNVSIDVINAVRNITIGKRYIEIESLEEINSKIKELKELKESTSIWNFIRNRKKLRK